MTTSERILASALLELDARGLDGLSLRAVGVRAGLTPMAVYRHFADKADLLRAVGAHAFDVWQSRIAALPVSDLPAWLDGCGTAFVDFALDEPALFDAAFVLKTDIERVYPEDFRAGRSPVITLLTEQLQRGQAQGFVRAGDALELAMAVWAVLQGLAGLHRSGRFRMERADFTALCLRSAARVYSSADR
jgi:AcrR family transcriptional regulator